MVERGTYPDIIVILDELRVSEQTALQHGLQQSQVDHVEEQQTEDREVHDDGKLKERQQLLTIYNDTVHLSERAS